MWPWYECISTCVHRLLVCVLCQQCIPTLVYPQQSIPTYALPSLYGVDLFFEIFYGDLFLFFFDKNILTICYAVMPMPRTCCWLQNCKVAGSNLTCRDDWKTRWPLHSVDLTSMGLSSPGQNIIHSPVARVVYGWWALAYKLIRMPGSIGYVANHAIWWIRGSPDENTCFPSLSQAFRTVWLPKVVHPH